MPTQQMKVLDSGMPGDRVWLVLLAGFLFFVAIVLAAAGSGVGLGFVARIPGQDFTGHLAIYGTLAFLWSRGLQQRGLGSWDPRRWVAHHWALVLFVGAEELSQTLWTFRTFSWLDMTGNALGIWLGYGFSGLLWSDRD